MGTYNILQDERENRRLKERWILKKIFIFTSIILFLCAIFYCGRNYKFQIRSPIIVELVESIPEHNQFNTINQCSLQLVESIPIGLNFSKNSPKFLSTYEAWKMLLNKSENIIDIGAFYWTLRGVDIVPDPSAALGEDIFNSIVDLGVNSKRKIRIAQSSPNENNPDDDTKEFLKLKAAEVRSVDFPQRFGGVLHTKLWIVDQKHFYLGSANMDWRSLTQVKELGVLATNCEEMALDLQRIFEEYWYLGLNSSIVPESWPPQFETHYNIENPAKLDIDSFQMLSYLSSSPPPLTAKGRIDDIQAILDTISKAKSFINIAVMDYIPMMIYTKKKLYWPIIDDALRAAAVNKKIKVKLLISWWKHSNPIEDPFLRSLAELTNPSLGVDIQIRRFIVPDDIEPKLPFTRVNHNKYMVTDNTAYIGTSNWSGDYFVNTAGIAMILMDTGSNYTRTIRSDLESVFNRDWNSEFAKDFK